MRNGGVSFWWQQVGLPSPTDRLQGDTSCDVAIVGGGLTGLWTAYYLAEADPTLDVRVVEAEFAGFGASGRNGGWLSSELAGSARTYAAVAGEDGVRRLRDALRATVDEVVGVAAREGIEADIVRSGVLTVARSEAQRQRLDGELTAGQVADRIRVAGAVSGHFDPDCARVQPARLVAGVARVVRERGVRIHEGTRVTSVSPGTVVTDRGTLRAPVVLRCLEGFTAGLAGHRRDWLPMNSAIVVTAPLTDAQWGEIGWAGEELLGDEAHAYCYAQRTADGRIAMGGRGIPYRFGSRTDVDGRTQDRTVESLRSTLTSLFPSLAGVGLDHAWCGVLGVPRDWSASVSYDPATGPRARRRLRRLRAHRDQPGRPHAARPGARPRHRPDPRCRGPGTGSGGGSRSRCGGPACTRSTASTAPRTAARTPVCDAPAASPASRTASRDADLGQLGARPAAGHLIRGRRETRG